MNRRNQSSLKQRERERENANVSAACVCVYHLNRCKNFYFAILSVNMQGDWSRFAYPVQRSYGISVDEWSDQPLVTCIIYRFLRQGAKPRTPTTENLVFTQLSQSEIFFGVVFNLIRMVFLQSWWRAKPRTLQRLFSISGTLSMAGLICMRGDSVPNGSLKWSILV